MDWAAKLFGLADHFLNSSQIGGGVLQVDSLYFATHNIVSYTFFDAQTTASDSGLVAIVAARSRYSAQNPSAKLEDMIVYTTTQTHSLGAKAALVLGLECRALEVTEEDRFALRGDTLRKALEEDRRRGKHPFVLSESNPSNFRYTNCGPNAQFQLVLSERRPQALSTSSTRSAKSVSLAYPMNRLFFQV